MMDEKYMPLAVDYIEGKLSLEEEAELQGYIAAGLIDKQELQELASLYGKLPEHTFEVPTERMRNRFYATLAEEQQKAAKPGVWQQMGSWWKRFLYSIQSGQLAFGILLLLIGVGLGYWLRPSENHENQLIQLTNDVQQMRELMIISMLEQSSPTERLRAVNMGYDLPEADAKVINALLHTLNHDTNVNVRLAAVEALRQHAGQPMVRQGLIEAIEKQESAIVQIALADLMVDLQEKEAVEPIKKLLRQESMDETVRQKLEESIHTLI